MVVKEALRKWALKFTVQLKMASAHGMETAPLECGSVLGYSRELSKGDLVLWEFS